MAKHKTAKLAKKAAWTAFSRYIRLRDCLRFTGDKDEGQCITCWRPYPYKKLQAGHFIGGRTSNVLFAEDIVYSQCYGCNMGKSGNYLEYYQFMVRELGSHEAVEDIVNKYKQLQVKYKQHDYEDLEEYYNLLSRQLLT